MYYYRIKGLCIVIFFGERFFAFADGLLSGASFLGASGNLDDC